MITSYFEMNCSKIASSLFVVFVVSTDVAKVASLVGYSLVPCLVECLVDHTERSITDRLSVLDCQIA